MLGMVWFTRFGNVVVGAIPSNPPVEVPAMHDNNSIPKSVRDE
jgi:hypothetical protein